MKTVKGCTSFLVWCGIIGLAVIMVFVVNAREPTSSRDPTGLPATRTPMSARMAKVPTFTPVSYSVVSDSEGVAATSTAIPPEIMVDVQVANVRSGPSTDFSIVGSAGQGEKFVVTGKNLENNWLQIEYHGRIGWIFRDLGTIPDFWAINLAANIPATPSANRLLSPTRVRVTPIPTKRTAARCTFVGTEPRVPDPVGLAVYDCEAWSIAYYLLFHDRPEVAFASYDNNDRINLTHDVFNFLRKATLNCNTTPTEMAALAMIAGQRLEENADRVPDQLLLAPRVAILALLDSTTGTHYQCTAMIVGFLDGLLN